ncbi:MAG TPA: extracellular solute-binding protein [Thermoanaerobaculia bacterium]|nr:extracellular solute-binding protein [Thermoanaerobaculia bacterium]
MLRHITLVSFLAALLATACRREAPLPGTREQPVPAPKTLSVYSGRSETLIAPLLDRFSKQSGIKVNTRYGETAELAAMLLEEGKNSRADLFIAQDAAALGAVEQAGLFRALPDEVRSRVPSRFVHPDGSWIGLSGRARTVVYNSKSMTPEALPQALDNVVDRRWRGRFGIAPANASFQAHLAVYRVVHGREALARLLRDMARNEPKRYSKNSAIVDAVIAGEIEWGLVNHYYLWQALKQRPDAPAANFFMPKGDASSFINLAGVGVMSPKRDAIELVRFLLSDEAQRYFASETYEYPVVPGIDAAVDLVPLSEVRTPEVNFADVSAVLGETLTMLQESGLLE